MTVNEILEHDRTKVAECVTAIKNELNSYSWLIEGRGSYEWDDDHWHNEFKQAVVEIEKAMEPMVKIAADWTNCPKTQDEICKARQLELEYVGSTADGYYEYLCSNCNKEFQTIWLDKPKRCPFCTNDKQSQVVSEDK